MKTKRFLSIALTLVMLLGMLPGMSLTASAAGTTKTITPGTDNPKTGTGTMTITLIIKGDPAATDFDVTLPTSLTYDGKAKTAAAAAKSAVTGMGTITVEYYKGGTKIDSAVDVGDYTFKLKVAAGTHYNAGMVENADWKFTITKGAPTVTAPTTKTLTYTGSAQELVNAGSTKDGKLYYAVTTENTAPTDESLYTTSIPAKTEAGTYYVWYKVVGDANHNDTEPKCVKVNIAQKETESETEKQTESETEKQDPIPSGGGGGSIPQATTPVTIPAETVEEPTKEELQVPASIFLNSGFLVSWSGSKVRVSWGSVPEADSYEIYANYCGNKSCVRVASVSGATSAILKKLNGKKIKTKKFVKAYVIAYKNGVAIGRTILGHAAGPKSAYTNAKAVSVDQSAYQLKAGETAKVSATITKAKRNKKLPGINHGAKLRYASTNEGVATVDGNGVITAVGSGTCEVWIYALNGRSAKVTVNVN